MQLNITPIDNLYAVLGEAKIREIIANFYRRVPGDPVLGPMYPADDLAGAEERLRGFILYRLGGPQTYIEQRGHPRLRMRHAPFAIDQRAREHWVLLMDAAIDEAQIDPNAAAVLRKFLHDVATSMINHA
ncbi:MAG: globin domain-containing protein [Tepidisphaeraceae bacterium]